MIHTVQGGSAPHPSLKTMKAQGHVLTTDTNLKGAKAVAASGGKMTFTKAAGLGKEMVRNLDGVKKNYALQLKADRRAAALDRAAGW